MDKVLKGTNEINVSFLFFCRNGLSSALSDKWERLLNNLGHHTYRKLGRYLFKEFGSVSDARFLQMGRRLSRGWRSPCPPGRAESGPTALETWASFPSTVPGVTTLPPPSCWSR